MFITHVIRLLRRHKGAFLFAIGIALLLLFLGWQNHVLPKTIGYLLTLLSCFLVSEIIFFSGNLSPDDPPVRKPRQEFMVIVVCNSILLLLLIYVFMVSSPQALSGIAKTLAMVLRLLLAYPVFFLIYFLGIKRYSLKSIGISHQHWYLALPLIILIGGVSYLSFPEGVQFEEQYRNYGVLAFFTLGFLTAAIPEEISRHLFQTRLSRIARSKSLGWAVASSFWALTHIPAFSGPSSDYYGATISAIGILPMGLLWGYLNQRYRSILPSILIHGTNLWGLQNLF